MEILNDKYLKILSKHYPTISDVSTEIINLNAILNLPKGTEHFLTDINGESEAFEHVLRNASGAVKRKINKAFKDTLSIEEKNMLATLVYYPKEKIKNIKKNEKNMEKWYRRNIYRLIILCRAAGYKYTRSKVRKSIPSHFQYIIEELFHEKEDNKMKTLYYYSIIDGIIDIDRADEFIITIAKVIRQLVVDHLHIIGDIFDRGQGAHKVMDTLKSHHSVDIQWGNHDILWMGAASGSLACIANALRIAFRYGTLDTLEIGYGINLSPLVRFTLKHYLDNSNSKFKSKVKKKDFKQRDIDLMSRMQKAIAIIQFKLEGQIIKRRPELKMGNRLLLDKIDLKNGTITIENIEYDINDTDFPTLNLDSPYELNTEEIEVMDRLKDSFIHSDKLQSHVKFLYKKGSMYKVFNDNLLYHACIPMTENGEFKSFEIENKKLNGKELLDYFDKMVNNAYFLKTSLEKEKALDMVWYLWCGENSPLFGKEKMATFERYFIEDKALYEELKNPYYKLRNKKTICNKILSEFGLTSKNSHIINGHVPVKVTEGESPIKADGKLIAIDGGFSKAYQGVTGIAGYTLIYNSQGMVLVSHEPFSTKKESIEKNLDMLPTTEFIEYDRKRVYVGDTDTGKRIKSEIIVLKNLLEAYKSKKIKQQL